MAVGPDSDVGRTADRNRDHDERDSHRVEDMPEVGVVHAASESGRVVADHTAAEIRSGYVNQDATCNPD